MSARRKKNANSSERGIALVIVLLVLLLITMVVAGMMVMSTTDTAIGANFRDEQRAFFAARAGLEETRDRLRKTATDSLYTSLPTALPGTASSILYVTNPAAGEVVTPWLTAGSNYPDTEICNEVPCTNGVPAGNPWYINPAPAAASTSYAASPKLPWKWVRFMIKPNKSATGTSRIPSVDGAGTGTSMGARVCWNGTNELVTTNPDCGANAPVYMITALAVTPGGSRRMLQYEETINVNVPVVAALYAKNGITVGDAMNITGNTEAGCSASSVYGAASGTSTVALPGGGNVTGAPAGTVNNYGWGVNIPAMINGLSYGSTDVTTVPGTTHDSYAPPNYTIPSAGLGTIPASGGTPVTYMTPDLTVPGTTPASYRTLNLGGGGTGVTGYGILIVRGNLVIDASPTLDYYGLIIVQGDLTIKSSSTTPVNPRIHGTVLVGGAFSTNLTNMSGSISISQNACMVQNVIGGQFYKTVAQRELVY